MVWCSHVLYEVLKLCILFLPKHNFCKMMILTHLNFETVAWQCRAWFFHHVLCSCRKQTRFKNFGALNPQLEWQPWGTVPHRMVKPWAFYSTTVSIHFKDLYPTAIVTQICLIHSPANCLGWAHCASRVTLSDYFLQFLINLSLLQGFCLLLELLLSY